MKVKQLALFAAAALCVASCSKKESADSEQPRHIISISNIDAEDGALVLLYGAEDKIDSTTVANHTAIFVGDYSSEPAVVPALDRMRLAQFVVVDTDTAFVDAATCTVTSPLNDLLVSALSEAQLAESQEELDNRVAQFVRANADNSAGAMMMLMQSNNLSPDTLSALFDFAPRLAKVNGLNDVYEWIQARKATAAGQKYTDYEVPVTDDLTVKLSDYVKPGQYTLVDYWASWCGPCRKEIEGMKEIYAQYHPKGLEIVGVAVWEDPEATTAWLEQNPLPWPVILNAQRIPTELYGINGIPCIMLIGPDGTIVARDLFGEEILKAVQDAFPE